MNRRTLLRWLSRGLSAVTAGVIGIPAVQYVRGTLKQAEEPAATFRRVARLSDLQPGRPTLVPVLGIRRDAWTVEPDQIIGRVWLISSKSPDETESDSGAGEVTAFTTVCPHMGCQVQLQGDAASFACPCHRAVFSLDGARIQDSRTGESNHAPRGLDSLDCRIVQDADSGESWVEVLYQRFETGSTQKVPV